MQTIQAAETIPQSLLGRQRIVSACEHSGATPSEGAHQGRLGGPIAPLGTTTRGTCHVSRTREGG